MTSYRLPVVTISSGLFLTFFRSAPDVQDRLTDRRTDGFGTINRTETDNMAAKLALCKSRFISIDDVTDLTLDAANFSSMY